MKCNEGEDCIAPSVDVRARVESEEGFDELDPATVELDLHEPGRLYIDNIELDGTASSAITITHYDRGNANEPSLQLDFSTVYIGREPTKSVEFDLSNDGATAVRVDINIGDLSGEGAQGMGGVLCSGSTGSGGGGSRLSSSSGHRTYPLLPVNSTAMRPGSSRLRPITSPCWPCTSLSSSAKVWLVPV